MNNPLVTVFVLSYNYENYIVDALNSVKDQTYKNIQFIILDDCSTDNSVEIIENWIIENNIVCTFIKHELNVGICKSLNEVLKIALGKYISACSSDDMITPEKVNEQVSLFETLNEGYGIIYGDAFLIDSNGVFLNESFLERYTKYKNSPPAEYFFENLLFGNFIHPGSCLYRLELLKKVGGFDENLYAEDWDIHIRLSLETKFYFYPKKYYKYRIQEHSANHDKSKRELAIFSSYKSLRKYFGISVKGDENILITIKSFSDELYKINSKYAKKPIGFIVSKKPTISNILFYLFCSLKISYKTFLKFNRLLSRVKKRLKKL